ncbi:hypothetical protein WUBG_05939, partial [Wuchereria bancrofti]
MKIIPFVVTVIWITITISSGRRLFYIFIAGDGIFKKFQVGDGYSLLLKDDTAKLSTDLVSEDKSYDYNDDGSDDEDKEDYGDADKDTDNENHNNDKYEDDGSADTDN